MGQFDQRGVANLQWISRRHNICDPGRISCHQVTSQRLEFPALRRREDSTIGLGG